MTIRQWLRTPKSLVLLVLTVYWLLSIIWAHDPRGLRNGIVAVVFAVLADVACCLYKRRTRILPDGAAITGLIVALVLSTSSSMLLTAAVVVLALVLKHVLVYRKRPVFNPAALGLLLSVPLFHAEQSWWGAFGDFPWWSAALLLVGGYLVTGKVQKFPLVFAFLGTCFTLLLILGLLHAGDAADALRSPFIDACLFCAFLMLTDPPTSPARRKHQIVFGILAAATGVIVYAIAGGLMYLFIGLIVGNVYHLLISPAASANGKKPRLRGTG